MSWINNQSEKRKALLALTASSFIWGASTPLLKWMLAIMPVFLLAFLRFFSASILLLIFRPKLKIDRKDIPTIIYLALLGSTFHIPIFFWGLHYTSAINAAVLGSATPLITLIFASFFLKERIKSNLLLGGLVGITGTAIILFQGISQAGLSMSIFGNFLLLISTLSWVLYEVVSKKIFKKYDALTITFYTSFIGGVSFIPLALFDIYNLKIDLVSRPEFYIGVPVSIVFTSTIAYFLWQWGLSKFEVARAGFFQYLNPIIGTVASYFFLGEKITTAFVIGAIFIFSGVVLAEKKFHLHLPEFHLLHHILKPKLSSKLAESKADA